MCGRSCLSLSKSQIQSACSYKCKENNKFITPDWLPEHNDGRVYAPSHNIAPTDVTPVLVSASKYNNAKSSMVLKPMMWGIIPPWCKGDYRTHNISTNNCRIENVMTSKLYSPILRNGGRCVIIFEGFYEWQTVNTTSKNRQPYYIYAQQKEGVEIDDPQTWNYNYDEKNGWSGINLLRLAGLYNVWQNEDKIIYSYTVITMESNKTLDWLHHRMPAVLNTDELTEAWLDIENVSPEKAISLLRPANILNWHPVSTIVNNSRNKSVDCNKKIKAKNEKAVQNTLNSWLVKGNKRKINEDDVTLNKRIKFNE